MHAISRTKYSYTKSAIVRNVDGGWGPAYYAVELMVDGKDVWLWGNFRMLKEPPASFQKGSHGQWCLFDLAAESLTRKYMHP